MNALVRFYQSSVGKKYIVALSGLALVGFVIVHMLGNFTIYLGPEVLNAYAHKLKSSGPLLWIFRIGLLAIFLLHVVNTIQLAKMNRKARPDRYAKKNKVQASTASLTMVISGTIIGAFVIYHLMQFTIGVTDPAYLQYRTADGHHDVFRMVVTAFSNPLVVFFYILAMALLCLHLSHGFASAFQSLGVRNNLVAPALRYASYGLAAIIFIGNSSMPLAILMGFITLPNS